MSNEHELFGEMHEQEEYGLFGNEHRRQHEQQDLTPTKMKAPITYTIDRSKDFRKSVIIWKENTGYSSPIAYIHKPKHVSEDDFNKFLDSIKIYIKS